VLVPQPEIVVRRWPTERPLLILNGLASAGLWALFMRSPQALAYLAATFGFMALMNVAFVAYIRGSAVCLGPEQFGDLYARVCELARRMGLRRMPAVYLMQQDGALNAFAMRFLRSHMVVLLSDLLEACGDNRAAENMIIGHELGHIRAGHLRARWLLMPSSVVPFLGSALSRAREYTCDRYGAAAAGDCDGALVGLAILSAGGRFGPFVNRAALASQRRDLRTGWMLVGEWLGSHPPLSKRLTALAPAMEIVPVRRARSALHWLRAAFAAIVVVVVGVGAVAAYLPRLGVGAVEKSSRKTSLPSAQTIEQVHRDLERLKAVVQQEQRNHRPLPWDDYELYARWDKAHPGEKHPIDPFSGYWYDYDWHGDAYRIWSMGPDGKNHTADDIVLDSRQ
jgi:Zn-dependent protease with chaperone function